MCGIVGYIGAGNAADILIDGLRKLEYRGYDSAGIAIFSGSTLSCLKATGRLANLEGKIKSAGNFSGHCGIGHTRWATHGAPLEKNAHPHGNDTVKIVHNGIIENYMQIREELEAKGIVFESDTDTETVAGLLKLYYNGNPEETIREVLKELKGSYALGILFKDFPDRLYAVRKDSPLIVGLADDGNFIASDVPAILRHTRNYCLLEENEIVCLTKDSADISDMDGNPLTKEVLTATWNIEAAEKGGFDHFMLKEIFEQPVAVSNTISPRIKDGIPNLGLAGLTSKELAAYGSINIVACGTAMHAGMIGKYVIEKLCRIPVNVDIASEFRYRDPILSSKDLVIIVSQSGETADTLAALRLAKKKGAHTLAIVNVVGSSIAREADGVLYTWAGPEIAVASTKAYSVQVAVFYLLAFSIALEKGLISQDKCWEYCADLLKTPAQIEAVLKNAGEYRSFAEEFKNAEDLFFIGRGLDYALALEGSLKLKEISYIHSEAYAAGELKHGTISLITDGMPVIALATQTALYEKMVSNIKEVKARGAKVLLVCREGARPKEQLADYVIEIPHADDLLIPLVAAPPLQMIAYYASVLRGCDVDKPRNLAKSVTVE